MVKACSLVLSCLVFSCDAREIILKNQTGMPVELRILPARPCEITLKSQRDSFQHPAASQGGRIALAEKDQKYITQITVTPLDVNSKVAGNERFITTKNIQEINKQLFISRQDSPATLTIKRNRVADPLYPYEVEIAA